MMIIDFSTVQILGTWNLADEQYSPCLKTARPTGRLAHFVSSFVALTSIRPLDFRVVSPVITCSIYQT